LGDVAGGFRYVDGEVARAEDLDRRASFDLPYPFDQSDSQAKRKAKGVNELVCEV
jgi:hypothetical protein